MTTAGMQSTGTQSRGTQSPGTRSTGTDSASRQTGGSQTGRAGHGSGPGYVSKTDMVAALIREQIMTGELAAGEQLRQRDLAQRFQVSQTPVREAMRRLESEGLVIGDTHRGFTVVEPDDGPVEENLQIRAALESLGASLAASKIDAAGLARLEELNNQMRALGDAVEHGEGDADPMESDAYRREGDADPMEGDAYRREGDAGRREGDAGRAKGDPRYAVLNREFHFTVYEYARSPLLLSLMRLLWASLYGGPKTARTHAESARQHDVIVAALRAADPAAAAASTYQHIMGSPDRRC
jgi:DNA-binding GntR family transcriptional regulator